MVSKATLYLLKGQIIPEVRILNVMVLCRYSCPAPGSFRLPLKQQYARWPVKPFVLRAQTRELYGYIKSIEALDRAALLEINVRILKMQLEVSETMKKLE